MATPRCVADQHVELSDLVCVLARGRHLDRPRPVKIAVTERECQLLDLQLLQRALVQGHEAVRSKHAPLISRSWRDEEVEGLLCAFGIAALRAAFVFYEATIDDTTTRRVV